MLGAGSCRIGRAEGCLVVIGGSRGVNYRGCLKDLNFDRFRNSSIHGEGVSGRLGWRDFHEANSIDCKWSDVIVIESDSFTAINVPAEERALSKCNTGDKSVEGID